MWIQGFLTVLSPHSLIYLFLGTAIGLVVGVLPALGPAFAVALMLPFTFGMDTVSAIVFLVTIHAACAFGDSVTSILVRTPGSAATVPSTWDGYPLTEQGKGAMALGISAFGSFFGGLIGWIVMVLVAGLISKVAMSIGAPEYFALGLMALLLISIASKGQTIKGLIWAAVGLAVSFIGADPITGIQARFSFGIVWLEGGIPLVVSMLGLFAVPQVISMLSQGTPVTEVQEFKGSILSGLMELLKRPFTIIRSAIIGLYIGILPALGSTVATTTSYLVEQKYSPDRENFGKGAPAGLIAAEVSKGACVVADLIPTFMLGVPGSMATAITLAALIYHGLQPGPRFLTSGSVVPYAIFAGVLMAQFLFAISGTLLAKPFAKIARIPAPILAPILAMLTIMGVFPERRATFDLFLVIGFGLIGWISKRLDYPVVSLVLGALLGSLVETNFHRSLQIGMGSYSVFFTRPITVVLLLITLAFMVGPLVTGFLQRRRSPGSARKEAAVTVELPDRRSVDIELAMLIGVIALFGSMIIMSFGYGPQTRMFPLIVMISGLALVLYRLAWLLSIRKSAAAPAEAPAESRVRGQGMPLWLAILVLVGYVVALSVLGFGLATLLFLGIAAVLAGYRRRAMAWTVAVVTAVVAVAMGVLLRLPLPPGSVLPPWLFR